MPARGPKPAPTSLKILRGTRPDRVNADEPRPPGDAPDPPATLGAAARAEWDRMAAILATMGVLTRADGPALEIYCQAAAQAAAADAKVRTQGMLVAQGTGGFKINPHVTIAAQARAAMLRVLCEFGCTPSSRSKVTVQTQAADPLAEMMRRRRKNP